MPLCNPTSLVLFVLVSVTPPCFSLHLPLFFFLSIAAHIDGPLFDFDNPTMASIHDNSTMQPASKALAMASLQVESRQHATNTNAKHTGTVYDDHDMQRMGKVQELKVNSR
jgi:hypothetical protein